MKIRIFSGVFKMFLAAAVFMSYQVLIYGQSDNEEGHSHYHEYDTIVSHKLIFLPKRQIGLSLISPPTRPIVLPSIGEPISEWI